MNWTNDDRVALTEFLNKGLGQKFLRYLLEQEPEAPEGFDHNAMVAYGFELRGYHRLLNQIHDMSRTAHPDVPVMEHVETLTD